MSSEEQKEEKPKKAFLIKTIVWEDGEVDCDIREYKKIGSGRGAPTLCGPLNKQELKDALSDLGLSAEGVLDTIGIDLGIKGVDAPKGVDDEELGGN
jgi:hypothetical protein